MNTTSAAARVLALIALLALSAGEDVLGDTGAKIGLNFTGADQRQSGFSGLDTNGAGGIDQIERRIADGSRLNTLVIFQINLVPSHTGSIPGLFNVTPQT